MNHINQIQSKYVNTEKLEHMNIELGFTKTVNRAHMDYILICILFLALSIVTFPFNIEK